METRIVSAAFLLMGALFGACGVASAAQASAHLHFIDNSRSFTVTPRVGIDRTGKAFSDVLASPVCGFRYFGALPEFSTGAGKAQNHRAPMAITTKGAKKPDLLIQGDSRLWYSCNESKRGKILFSEPQVLRTTTQADFESDGAAVLEDNKLVVRKPDGALMLACVVGQDVPALEMGAVVKDTTGASMRLETSHFSLVDFDHDGTPDLVGGFNDGLYYYKGRASFHDIGGGTRKIHDISFEPESRLILRHCCCLTPGVGDLNGDGRTELLCGINSGNLMVWMNDAAKSTIGDGAFLELTLENQPKEHFVRELIAAHLAVDDFDGDGTPDMILGGNAGRELVSALGVASDVRTGNQPRSQGRVHTCPKEVPER